MTALDRRRSMRVYQEQPLNAGPSPEVLRQAIVTPQEHFFVRSHGSVPYIDSAEYRLSIGGLVSHPLGLSLGDLRRRFPIVELSATLQCAGLRRDELLAVGPIEGELPWGRDAVSNAIWRGVPLCAVLAEAGVDAQAEHVEFCGLDSVQQAGRSFGFGASIPLAKALSEEVLLAFEMNGEPLSPVHGFPLRVVVPGYIGARSVKWLGAIRVQKYPSDNYFQALAYKLFPAHVKAEQADWERAQMITELPVNSVICEPDNSDVLSAGMVAVRGYALSGTGHAIELVELSCDGGGTWRSVPIVTRQSHWAWCFWEMTVRLPRGEHQLVVRASDAAGHTQPAELTGQWNFKGYLNHAWHRVTITAA